MPKKFSQMTPEERIAYLEKRLSTSDIASAGKLNTEQALKFISLTTDNTKLKEFVKVYTMTANTRDLDNFSLATRQMRKPSEGTDPVSLVAGTFGKRTLTAIEWIYPVNLTYSFLEDNIERDDFEGFLMGEISKATGNDLEDLNFNGDTTSGDAFLSQNDGWIKIAKAAGHVYDTDGVVAPEGGYLFSDAIFPGMLAAMPEKWQRDPSKMKILLSVSDLNSYNDEISNRQTALGDEALIKRIKSFYKGIHVEGVPCLTTGTYMLTIEGNLARGIQRNVSIESERKPRARTLEVTVTGRQDAEIEIVDAVVIGYDTNP